MSELPNSLRNLAKTVNDQDTVLVAMIREAAKRIEELEASPKQQLRELGLSVAHEQRGIEIALLREALDLERKKVQSARKAEEDANAIITKIAKAAECDDFADVILARVEALAQQSNAMVRICEGHIANCRKAENANARLNQTLSMVQNERDEARRQLEDVKGQLQSRGALLHEIADVLGAGSRNAIPARDWFMDRVSNWHSHFREYLDIIGEAVGKPGLSYKDLADYFRGLNVEGLKKIADTANALQDEKQALADKLANATRYVESRDLTLQQLASALGVDQSECGWATKMIDAATAGKTWRGKHQRVMDELHRCNDILREKHNSIEKLKIDLTDAQKGAASARNDLALAEGAIKRMHGNLLMHKGQTDIWPNDGVFRAKLDEIEWCLYIYVGRFVEALNVRKADTRFIADVRDALSHEILRRNGQ